LSPVTLSLRACPKYHITYAASQQNPTGSTVYIVVIGWLYVALMMAVAEATNANGSVLGAIVTFLLYGAGPVALVVYLMQEPARRRRRKAAALAERTVASAQPDAGGEAAADPVAAVRKEP
jgi:hypothetical protein